MKTMKMCLKYKLLFTIPWFRELDEKKIEVEDEKGRKSKWKTKMEENKKIVIIPYFRFISIDQIPCFRFNSKTRKTTQNSFLIHI